MIPVTRSFLPPLEAYQAYLQRIWEVNQLTNNGPLVRELEAALKAFLGVKHLFFVSNGTVALQLSIRALGLQGEVLTTPFSYVATTSSIVWEGCQPVFVDIDPGTLCLDAGRIEAAITPRTSAILATHVYGIPCAVEEIEAIARQHGLKVLYDAAHAFGGRYRGRALAAYGDAATLSFHATKLFHTVEGGAIVTQDDEVAQRISYLRNFGHKGQEDFWGLGINGKNSEMHAAMGLCNLPYVEEIMAARQQVSGWYDEELEGCGLTRPEVPAGTAYNYAYYPVLFKDEDSLLGAKAALNAEEIFPRRYFYPSLNRLPYALQTGMQVSEDAAARVLCLPLFGELEREQVRRIVQILRQAIGR